MKGIISAGDKKTAEAGGKVLKNGGNAFDALTACIFAAHISEPALTSPAGGGFLLTNKNNYEFYDFFVNVPDKPSDNNIDFYPIEVDFGSATQIFHIGCGSIAVPGLLKGILDVHEKYGKLSLEDVLQPAVDIASNGIYLTEFQIYVLKILEPIFLKYNYSKKIFARNDKILKTTDLFKNEEYSEFLKILSKKGSKLFYKDEVADKIDKISRENNGLITKQDLVNYKTHITKPIKFLFGEYEIITSPPPSLGGLLIKFTLSLLKNISMFKWGSYEYLLCLINAMKSTQIFRKNEFKNLIADNNKKFKDIDINILKNYTKSYLSSLNPLGNTTHISIKDDEGNMVSCTSSNGEGAGLLIPDTGIMLNNMLGEEDLNPEGFFKWKPGIRLPSMMTPTIVLKNNKPILVLGSSGSNRIRSAIIQSILSYLVYNFDICSSVKNPRIHFENDTVYIEPGFSNNIINVLKNEFNVVDFDKKNLFFGGVQAVTGNMQGASDKRRQGFTLFI